MAEPDPGATEAHMDPFGEAATAIATPDEVEKRRQQRGREKGQDQRRDGRRRGASEEGVTVRTVVSRRARARVASSTCCPMGSVS